MGELFLAAVGGCLMSNLLAAIKARKADIGDVRVEVVAALADSPARFAAVELRVAAERADKELLERLVEIADRGCIMMNTLRGSWKCECSHWRRRLTSVQKRLGQSEIQCHSSPKPSYSTPMEPFF